MSTCPADCEIDNVIDSVDTFFLITMGIFILIIQMGFSFLEVGSIRENNTRSILLKNLIDVSTSAVGWVVLGYGIAFGSSWNGFIGKDKYFFNDVDSGYELAFFFFQFTFACTTATIVSGAIAERMKTSVYIIDTVWVNFIQYPLIVHWVWNSEGFLAKFGYSDFAGASVVHMTGGIIGLVGTVMLGPRLNRFHPVTGEAVPIPGSSILMKIFGVWFIYIGFLGFNCGSLLNIIDESKSKLGEIAIKTTIMPAIGLFSSMIFSKKLRGFINIDECLNGFLTVLIATTAIVYDVNLFWCLFLSFIIGPLSICISEMTKTKFQIDDPVDVVTVHGFGGLSSIISLALFHESEGLFTNGKIDLLGKQLVGVCLIAIVSATLEFVQLKFVEYYLGGLRVSEEVEVAGLDSQIIGTKANGEDKKIVLTDIWRTQSLYNSFKSFLIGNYQVENLDFINAVKKFEHEVAEDEGVQTILEDEIYKRFISMESPSVVNISARARNSIMSKRHAKDKNIWNEASREIFNELEKYFITSYSKSILFDDYYKKYIIDTKKSTYLINHLWFFKVSSKFKDQSKIKRYKNRKSILLIGHGAKLADIAYDEMRRSLEYDPDLIPVQNK